MTDSSVLGTYSSLKCAYPKENHLNHLWFSPWEFNMYVHCDFKLWAKVPCSSFADANVLMLFEEVVFELENMCWNPKSAHNRCTQLIRDQQGVTIHFTELTWGNVGIFSIMHEQWERPCTNICTCSKFLQNAFTVWNKVWTVWNKTSTKSQSRKLSLWQQFYGLIMFAENTITDSSYLFQSPYVDSWIDILIPVTYSNHITSTHAQIRDNKLWTWEFGVILHEKTSKTQLLANGHMLQWISGCFHIYTECVPGQTIASVITKP